MKKIIVASNNPGKIAEIKAILKDKFEIVSLKEANLEIDPEETGTTFFENALIKAKAVYELSGCYALSDDSGLCVEALNGAPGVYSARFSGEHSSDKDNNKLLLEKMAKIKDRSAKFVSSVVMYFGSSYIEGCGETYGEILFEERGGNGFGYDPLFYSKELNKTFAEASSNEKNAVSHRARALKDLVTKLENYAE